MIQETEAKSLELTLHNKIKAGKKLSAVYLTLGYPDLKTSIDTMIKIAEFVDIIEIGIPFSDPIADGPVIQRTSQIALENGTIPTDVWSAVAKIKTNTNAQVVIMTYANIILQFENFEENCNKYGVDGLIVPDIPFGNYENIVPKNRIYLISPNTPFKRIKLIVQAASGYIYLISQLGTTGSNFTSDNRNEKIIDYIKSLKPQIPVFIGFGISSKQDIQHAHKIGADGVIVGSSFLQRLDEDVDDAILYIMELMG